MEWFDVTFLSPDDDFDRLRLCNKWETTVEHCNPNAQHSQTLSACSCGRFDSRRSRSCARLWPHVEELYLDGFRDYFEERVSESLLRNFPMLKKLKMKIQDSADGQLFDTLFSNHPNLLDFELDERVHINGNWFRSCHVPLERFAVMGMLPSEDANLDTLESCCKNSLQTIHIRLKWETRSRLMSRVFATFPSPKQT